MRPTLPAAAAALALGIATLAVSSPASADPKGFFVPLTCDNGNSYSIAVSGNGQWTPGHDVDSTTMLIPTAFGPFHGVLTDDDGNVVEEFTDPPVTKGGKTSKQRRTSVNCTFTVNETFEIPEIGVVHFHGEGSVSAFTTPAR